MSFRDDLLRHAHDLETERDAAFDLWTWLPSYQITRRAHGDHAMNFVPSNADVMRETTELLSRIAKRHSWAQATGVEEPDFPFNECCCDDPESCPSPPIEKFNVELFLQGLAGGLRR